MTNNDNYMVIISAYGEQIVTINSASMECRFLYNYNELALRSVRIRTMY
jgi:hypothetical protein